MQTTYSKTFKIEAVKKVLSRTSETPVSAIAKSLGVANTTLHGWIKAMGNKDLSEPFTSEGLNEKKSCQWSSQERFEAILDAKGLSQEQLSEYCRKKGIFPHHLESWKKDFIEGSIRIKSSDKNKENKALKEENKQLSKELRRKEKALAETAALLVLKKKVEDYWGVEEED